MQKDNKRESLSFSSATLSVKVAFALWTFCADKAGGCGCGVGTLCGDAAES
jgi:hypothetical protein